MDNLLQDRIECQDYVNVALCAATVILSVREI